MISRPQAAPPRPRREARKRQRRVGAILWPITAVAAVIGVAAAAAFGTMALLDDNNGDGTAGATNTPIRLAGVAAYDPEGGDGEHDADAPDATDGQFATYWTTETYNDFENTKQGVGLVLDARRKVDPDVLTIRTDTPGFTAEIRAGDDAGGPFDRVVSESKTVVDRTEFELDNASARYFVVWITALDSLAHVNEVRAA
jgi:hypothetical protein